MTNLISYTVHTVTKSGDWDITMRFDDKTENRQTIRFGLLDDVENGPTAVQQLDDLVTIYANAYEDGLAAVTTQTSDSITAILGTTREMSFQPVNDTQHVGKAAMV